MVMVPDHACYCTPATRPLREPASSCEVTACRFLRAIQIRTRGLCIYGSLAHNTSNESVGNADPKHYHFACDKRRRPQTRHIFARLFADCAGRIRVCASASLVAFILLTVGGN